MESPGLPQMPASWRVDARSGSDAWVDVASFTDPLCPWAYSFEPVLRTLEARFGDQLRFRTVLIGLAEDREHYRAVGPRRTSATAGSGCRSRRMFARMCSRAGPPVA
jgi:predicted DsbA family dithiol-disulfide isomerase